MSTQNKNFAYGKDTIGGCCCPAVAAGFAPNTGDESTEIAETYDYYVRELDLGNAHSVIPEEKARQAWLAAVESIEEDEYAADRKARVGRDIAEDLGWL
ncbi:hypothetical protein M1M41_gp039 [Halorubrum sodomense tailed virus 4]|uniref:Uncharacterized protein n=1 Tax=Halorubrum sodomense tailed virus 4 TaxID=2878013 RepID=A0AAE8XTW0_9CAUD|nr:hypothetical protein M1M41_gp039 [Halorubrum sodomense tailed virus 4]UBF20292.1 hypothetical protein HSTV-4_gp85 [Halorubrum sodomense tailed virus 4]UBF21582.1 hypothetical protein HRTV-24_gp96 [Halorubrum virus HRTV-24]UBF21981.1 hypothetical protein HJTV-3_gp92 [Haloarcula virus HJTV-3]UBF22110.1 hypothetical protein HRTV-15_gp91 [Halorubrum virus HRTV-15]